MVTEGKRKVQDGEIVQKRAMKREKMKQMNGRKRMK